ncbi:ROK family protein [Ensifer soli]|uniref:ROK family protein n=1 Tax=Ciceribacter sp. sgz301302 TaxID=3342379 RepID=UPI0035BA54D2
MAAIGIDIGGTNIRAARVSAEGTILAKVSAPSGPDAARAVDRILSLIADIDAPEVRAIGIGVPGRVDPHRRRVLSGGYLDLSTLDLAGMVEERTGRPVHIDNDCSMALVAEMAVGVARGRGEVAMLTIGTGIGGALASGGRILRGSRTAGQLGHITIDIHGQECLCGRRGCVETTSSGTALRRRITQAGLARETTAGDLMAHAAAGDAVAQAILTDWAAPLRAAIDTLSASVDPELVLLGGGLGREAASALERIPAGSGWFRPQIEAAALGDDAGVIGAALAALGSIRPAGKRAVLVNGVPAAGKSGVAGALARATGWPVLALDTVKNPFLKELGGGDRAFNRTLGRASYAAIFSILRDAPDGTTVIIDAWFGFQPIETLRSHLETAGVTAIAELWCHAPPEVLAERYAARLDSRPAGHPGADYIPELVALAGRAAPTGLADAFAIDTTETFALDPVLAFVHARLGA